MRPYIGLIVVILSLSSIVHAEQYAGFDINHNYIDYQRMLVTKYSCDVDRIIGRPIGYQLYHGWDIADFCSIELGAYLSRNRKLDSNLRHQGLDANLLLRLPIKSNLHLLAGGGFSLSHLHHSDSFDLIDYSAFRILPTAKLGLESKYYEGLNFRVLFSWRDISSHGSYRLKFISNLSTGMGFNVRY